MSGAVAAPTGTSCRVDLLRGFCVRVGDDPLQLPHVAQRLVALLALQDRPRERLFVGGVLWTDVGEERAAASLRSALWRLGRAGAVLVAARGTQLALADGVRVDVRETSAQARSLIACDADDALDTADVYDFDCDLLPDWYDDWVLLERERFRHLRLHALEALCRTLAQRGRFGEATEAGMAAVAGEPLRESAHRALIAAHLTAGNMSEALRQYRLCARLLYDELGVAPSPLLDELLDRVPQRA